jgi:hypothetical protein
VLICGLAQIGIQTTLGSITIQTTRLKFGHNISLIIEKLCCNPYKLTWLCMGKQRDLIFKQSTDDWMPNTSSPSCNPCQPPAQHKRNTHQICLTHSRDNNLVRRNLHWYLPNCRMAPSVLSSASSPKHVFSMPLIPKNHGWSCAQAQHSALGSTGHSSNCLSVFATTCQICYESAS